MNNDDRDWYEFDERPHYERSHRGGMILAFGILSLVLVQCGGVFGLVFGILAWVMGNSDLRGMADGEVDPEGKQITLVGKILGIVGIVLNLLYIVAVVAYIVFIVAFVAMIPPQPPGAPPTRVRATTSPAAGSGPLTHAPGHSESYASPFSRRIASVASQCRGWFWYAVTIW